MSRRKTGRPSGYSGSGTRDIWSGGEMIDCIRCGGDPVKREGCTLCKGDGKIKVRELAFT